MKPRTNPRNGSRVAETEFIRWIKAMGDDEEIARGAEVTPRAVRSWREGKRLPRPETARLIVKRWRRVKIEHIYG